MLWVPEVLNALVAYSGKCTGLGRRTSEETRAAFDEYGADFLALDLKGTRKAPADPMVADGVDLTNELAVQRRVNRYNSIAVRNSAGVDLRGAHAPVLVPRTPHGPSDFPRLSTDRAFVRTKGEGGSRARSGLLSVELTPDLTPSGWSRCFESTIARMGEEDRIKRRNHTPEQIVRKFREADRLRAEGTALVEVCKHLEMPEQPSYRWRNQYCEMKADDAKRLKQLRRRKPARGSGAARARPQVGWA